MLELWFGVGFQIVDLLQENNKELKQKHVINSDVPAMSLISSEAGSGHASHANPLRIATPLRRQGTRLGRKRPPQGSSQMAPPPTAEAPARGWYRSNRSPSRAMVRSPSFSDSHRPGLLFGFKAVHGSA